MSRVRQAAQLLGKSGIAFLIALALFTGFSLAGKGGLAFLCILALIPLGIFLLFRGLRWVRRHSLWSLRNRLLVVYGLVGVLPVLLLFLLVGIAGWALMNELAIYLASSQLDRRLDSINAAVEALHRMPPTNRELAAPEVAKAFSHALPDIAFYFKDETGDHRYPVNAPALNLPPGWKNVSGLLVLHRHFYAWSHFIDDRQEISALAPLSDDTIENLVPHLGVIALVETHKPRPQDREPASAGSLTLNTGGTTTDPDFHFDVTEPGPQGRRVSRIPPPVSRFDVPVFIPSTRPHFHLDTPGKTYEGVLWVYSRPSAVLRTFFSGSESN